MRQLDPAVSKPTWKSSMTLLLFFIGLLPTSSLNFDFCWLENIGKSALSHLKKVLLGEESSIKGRKSYFEKRLLLREESFILKRDFYEEKTVLF